MTNSKHMSYAKSIHLENTSLQYIPCQQLKPAFHSSYFSHNTPYGSATTIWGIPSSMVEILLFDSVFHNGVTPVSVSTLKPPLRVIGAILLKP